MRKEILSEYFTAWINNDIEIVRKTFADDIIYTECYGPQYRGISQVLQWFEEWNRHGRVLRWDIKRVFESGNTIIAEWYFECEYEGNVDGFDGVTVADFDGERIVNLSEFQSKPEHYYPYGE